MKGKISRDLPLFGRRAFPPPCAARRAEGSCAVAPACKTALSSAPQGRSGILRSSGRRRSCGPERLFPAACLLLRFSGPAAAFRAASLRPCSMRLESVCPEDAFLEAGFPGIYAAVPRRTLLLRRTTTSSPSFFHGTGTTCHFRAFRRTHAFKDGFSVFILLFERLVFVFQ